MIGIDLAASCLRLAQEKTSQLGLAVTYRQGDCSATPVEDASADLVTSTMLLHELPRPVLLKTIEEAARILKPGGVLRFLDFTWTGEPFRDVAVFEHGERNNEPFMPGALSAPVVEAATNAGFKNARWVAFDERGKGDLGELRWPQRAEWHFPWAVFQAERT